MSEKEVSEERINDHLDELIHFEGDMVDLRAVIRFYAKIIFNLRYDLNEMKLELLKVFKPEGEEKTMEEVNGHFYS